jgi:uncharacterized lipoprotein YbaY
MVKGGCYRFARWDLFWASLLLSVSLLWLTPLSRAELPRSQSPSSPQQPTTSTPSPTSQQAPAQQTMNPGAPERSTIRFVLVRHIYQCAGGVQLVTIADGDKIRLTLNGNGQVYELEKAASAGSNRKYSSGSIVWSSDVQTGTLEDTSNAANPRILAKDCQLQSAAPLHSPANSISGTLNFAPAKDLPPETEVRVTLLDLKPSDEAHKYIGVTTFSVLGRKLPIPFELKFDPQNVRSKDCCALYAEIRVNGKARYATSAPQLIPDITQPSPMKLELVPVTKKTARQ